MDPDIVGLTQYLLDFQTSMAKRPGLLPAYHAIGVLLQLIEQTGETTEMGLIAQIDRLSGLLFLDCNSLSVKSGCEMFKAYISRKIRDSPPSVSMGDIRSEILVSSRDFLERLSAAQEYISKVGYKNVSDGDSIAIFGTSTCVLSVLRMAKKTGRDFTVTLILAAAKSENENLDYFLQTLSMNGIPVRVIPLSALSSLIRTITKFFVGSAMICKNGGIINTTGTSLIAQIAKAHSKGFFVFSEMIKFSTIFVLDSSGIPRVDIAPGLRLDDAFVRTWTDKKVLFDAPVFDYTEPKYITFIVTDSGVHTPSSIADELISIFFT